MSMLMDISKATFKMHVSPGYPRIVERACVTRDFSSVATEVNCSVRDRCLACSHGQDCEGGEHENIWKL